PILMLAIVRTLWWIAAPNIPITVNFAPAVESFQIVQAVIPLRTFSNKQQREPSLGFGVGANRSEAKKGPLLWQQQRIEHAADLNEDEVVFGPTKRSSDWGHHDFLRRRRDGIHLDLGPCAVEAGIVAHLAEIEIAPSEAVDVMEDIEDEFRG